MKVVIITQEDVFVIPRNIEKIVALSDVEVESIVVLNTKGSLINKKSFFIKGFGPVQTFRMALRLAKVRALDMLDHVFGWRFCKHKWSIRSVAKHYRIPFEIINNPNDEDFCNHLVTLHPDVIISFSAPTVFKSRLLNIPRLGCINLHCSYLPKYAGLLPSFWVLFHQETETGATVHYMDDKIDNGGILGQVKVPISPGSSMFDIIISTKVAGGNLMRDIIGKMACGEKIEIRPNSADDSNYFSWPTTEQMMEFRKRMGKFV